MTAKKKRRCTCKYANASNTPAVRSGHVLGGYLIGGQCLSCQRADVRRIMLEDSKQEMWRMRDQMNNHRKLLGSPISWREHVRELMKVEEILARHALIYSQSAT